MPTLFQVRRTALAAAFVAASLVASSAWAQNKGGSGGTTTTPAGGVITIDQARAEAGSVTAGDAPGFPVTISQPGSYRLTGNLNVAEIGATAIEIAADHVTLDLNGFTIAGPGLCSGTAPNPIVCQNLATTGSAVTTTPNKRYVKVHNGQARGFHTGVHVDHMSSAEDLVVSHTSTGIWVGTMSQALRNTVHLASHRGIGASNGVVRENAVHNAETGIFTSTAGLVERNRVHQVGTAIYGYAGPAGAAGNLITYAAQPFVQVVQMGPNLCNGLLCP
jgi:hypothetical protein